MKRDLELVRKILLALEVYGHGFGPAALTVAGYDQAVIEHHVSLLTQEHLIQNNAITWTGHDFLAIVRNGVVWATVTALEEQGIALPFAALQQLGGKILTAHMGSIYG
jgi:hypothetical protein